MEPKLPPKTLLLTAKFRKLHMPYHGTFPLSHLILGGCYPLLQSFQMTAGEVVVKMIEGS